MTSPVRTYLQDVRLVRASGSGTPEVSNYNALTNLLNEIGRQRHIRTFCIQNVTGDAGYPDFGLFAAPQLRKVDIRRSSFREAPPPERGVIEAKAPDEDVAEVARRKQVEDYWRRYGLVVVTNFRSFLVLGRDEHGRKAELERFDLAASAEAFWELAAHPGRLPAEAEQRFVEFLTRVLLQNAPLARPKDVAWFLASYARDALARIEAVEGTLPQLETVRETLEEALGISFEGGKGEHFFRSTLVQTLFYGLFSAWVLWCKHHPAPGTRPPFQLEGAAWHLRLPVLRALFEQASLPGALGPLNLKQVLDWAAATLRRVDDRAFFESFQEDRAVQYFYEPFLEAFDPELRKQLGVWYTPPEVVEYMVERVDRVLRDELEIADGLADDRVYVLDPCCGTGSYLVQVLRRIEATLRERSDDALVAQDVKRAAMDRVFGFEIMPAPFVVAHLQLGLLMENLGAPFETEQPSNGDAVERAAVLLTNALTGWEDTGEEQHHLPLPDFEREIERARKVKRETPILVVLGNPPYNSYAGTSSAEEGGLVDVYKDGLISKWGIRKFNLDDLYVRFLRIAERRITRTGRGLFTYISNYSYLADPSFVTARQRLLQEFDAIWIDCMNGDSRETGKLTPAGDPDPSVFSTEFNREGIKLGTAIGLFVRRQERANNPLVRYRDFWGADKRSKLLESLKFEPFDDHYALAKPDSDNRYSFRPLKVSPSYLRWPKPNDLCAMDPISGLQEMRRGALMSIDKQVLEDRMRTYLDPNVDWDALVSKKCGPVHDAGDFDAQKARASLLNKIAYGPAQSRRYALYPLDHRWCYWSEVRPLWNRPRPALVEQMSVDNRAFVVRMMAERPTENVPATMVSVLPDYHLLRPNAVAIPLRLVAAQGGAGAGDLLPTMEAGTSRANLSKAARAYIADLAVGDPDRHEDVGDAIWMHALATCVSPAYLEENRDGVRTDWPRIPLPASKERLEASAALGRQVANLLDVEQDVEGVTAAPVRPELRPVGVLTVTHGKGAAQRDLTVRARWGYAGQNGVTMPGKGDARERAYTDAERAAIAAGAEALGLPAETAFACLGESTFDVHLNDRAYWTNVPARVWAYTIGGYQVMKKWLSYREYDLLGRPLSKEEARYVQAMARRLAALLLLEPALDENYRAAAADPYPWPRTEHERA